MESCLRHYAIYVKSHRRVQTQIWQILTSVRLKSSVVAVTLYNQTKHGMGPLAVWATSAVLYSAAPSALICLGHFTPPDARNRSFLIHCLFPTLSFDLGAVNSILQARESFPIAHLPNHIYFWPSLMKPICYFCIIELSYFSPCGLLGGHEIHILKAPWCLCPKTAAFIQIPMC